MESLGKLIGGVSHEFNNYLTVILGFSEQLMMQLPPGTSEHSVASEINKAGERSADLTRGLLGLVRQWRRQSASGRCQSAGGRHAAHVERAGGQTSAAGHRVAKRLAVGDGGSGADRASAVEPGGQRRDAMPEGGRLTVETRAVILTCRTAKCRRAIMCS